MAAEDERSFERFVTARWASLLRTAFLLTGDWHTAEDLVQDALLRVSGRWRAIRDSSDAYTRRALINGFRDHQRRLARHVREAHVDAAASGTADDFAEIVAARNDVVNAVLRLPTRQREAVVLRYWLDLTVEETAECLNTSCGTVKSNTSRGIDRIRRLLDPRTTAEHQEYVNVE